jgi:hypothetical protein
MATRHLSMRIQAPRRRCGNISKAIVHRDLKPASDTRLTPTGQDAPTLDAPSWPIALKSLETSGPPVQLLVEGKEPPGVIMTSFDVAHDGRLLTMRRTGGDKRPSPRLVLVQNWRAAVGR